MAGFHAHTACPAARWAPSVCQEPSTAIPCPMRPLPHTSMASSMVGFTHMSSHTQVGSPSSLHTTCRPGRAVHRADRLNVSVPALNASCNTKGTATTRALLPRSQPPPTASPPRRPAAPLHFGVGLDQWARIDDIWVGLPAVQEGGVAQQAGALRVDAVLRHVGQRRGRYMRLAGDACPRGRRWAGCAQVKDAMCKYANTVCPAWLTGVQQHELS